jgi:signal transduction histidine kinase
LSGFPDHETHLQALESGGDDFLGKPFSSAELVIRIDNVLKVKYLQRDLLEEVQKSEDLAIQKDQLYEFIVHDIKNLLTGILANIELAGRSNDLAVVMRYIDRMNKSANGMRRMMQDLLDISRAEQVGIELQKTIINAPIFFKEICMLAEGLVKVKNQNFFSTCEVEEFYGDADLLKRALLNLVENSIKYSKEGSAIFLSARDIGNTALIEISVADNGVGIPEEYRDRIFEKYMRLESSASKARVSSGLGLSLCKVAIEAHGGKIWVEANHPTGSIFRIQLPKDGASRGTSV